MSFKTYAEVNLPKAHRVGPIPWGNGVYFKIKPGKHYSDNLIHRVTALDSTRVVSNITGLIYFKSDCIVLNIGDK